MDKAEQAELVHAQAAHAQLGDKLAMIGKAEEARVSYMRAIDDVAHNEKARIGLARLTLDYGGDLQQAENILMEKEWSSESQIESAILLSELMYRRGAVDDALATLVSVLGTHPSAEIIHKRIRKLSKAKVSGPLFRYNAR